MKKRGFAVLSALALLLCMLMSIPMMASAEAFDEGTAVDNADSLYWWTYWYDGYFAEGTDPSADVVYGVLDWLAYDIFADYEVYEEDSMIAMKIPETVYEEAAASHFVLTESLVAALRADESRYSDGYYYYYYGGWGDAMPSYVYRGYKDLGNGIYELYAYEGQTVIITEDWEYIQYVPSEDEVEGVDYIYIRDVYADEWGSTVVSHYAAKLLSTIVTKVDMSDGSVRFLANEQLAVSSMPTADALTNGLESTQSESPAVQIDFDRDVFEYGSQVSCNPIYEGVDGYDTAVSTMADVAETFVVYNITAVGPDYQEAQPNGTVTITFAIPEDFAGDAALFYVTEAGEYEQIPATLDKDNRTLTAELEHFSIYVLADMETASEVKLGDVTGDGIVDMFDAMALYTSVSGMGSLSEAQNVVADVTGDGIVDMFDALKLYQFVSGQGDLVDPDEPSEGGNTDPIPGDNTTDNGDW